MALKLLSTGPALDPRAARRLAREFETLADLSHPNVVKVFDTGVFHGYPYLAMELVEGLTLRHYLELGPQRRPRRSAPPVPRSARSPRVPWRRHRHRRLGPPRLQPQPPSPRSRPARRSRYSTGPECVRALADAADEPDTDDSRET